MADLPPSYAFQRGALIIRSGLRLVFRACRQSPCRGSQSFRKIFRYRERYHQQAFRYMLMHVAKISNPGSASNARRGGLF